MNLPLFDIKSVEQITEQDKIIFKNEYVDQDMFEMFDNEISILMAVCQFVETHKKCEFYSPYEDGEYYYASTAMDSVIIDSYQIMDKFLNQNDFQYEMLLAEPDEDAHFYYKCLKKIIYIEKYAISNGNKQYDIAYSYNEFYNMMKVIYNYTYDTCKELLENKYFDILLKTNIIRKLP